MNKIQGHYFQREKFKYHNNVDNCCQNALIIFENKTIKIYNRFVTSQLERAALGESVNKGK